MAPSSITEYSLLQIAGIEEEPSSEVYLKVLLPTSTNFDVFTDPASNPRKVFLLQVSQNNLSSITYLTKNQGLVITANFTDDSLRPKTNEKTIIKAQATSPILNAKEPTLALNSSPISIKIRIAPKVDKAEIETSKTQGKALSDSAVVSGYTASGASLALSVLSQDPSGAMVKFNQYLDFLSRFRLINIYFGSNLESFLGAMGDMKELKAETKQERDYIRKNQNGDKGKFNDYDVSLQIKGKLLYKLIGYNCSFLLVLTSWAMLAWMKAKNKAVVLMVYWIYYQRIIHHVVTGVAMPDIVFYGTRIILHSKLERLAEDPLTTLSLAFSLSMIWLEMFNIVRMVRNMELSEIGEVDGGQKEKKTSQVRPSSSRMRLKEEKRIELALSGKKGGGLREREEESRLRKRKSKHFGKYKEVKEINSRLTLEKISVNDCIRQHSISPLKPIGLILTSSACLLNNHLFTLKMATHQLVLASFTHLPGAQITILILGEVGDFFINIYLHFTKKHLRSSFNLLRRITGSLFIVLFLFPAFFILEDSGQNAISVDQSTQTVGKALIVIGFCVETLLVILSTI